MIFIIIRDKIHREETKRLMFNVRCVGVSTEHTKIEGQLSPTVGTLHTFTIRTRDFDNHLITVQIHFIVSVPSLPLNNQSVDMLISQMKTHLNVIHKLRVN
jgi:hypothetical protein